MSDVKIVGHDWADIRRAQQGGPLHKPIVPQPLASPTVADRAMLAEHGSIEALLAAGFAGVADRLSRDTNCRSASPSDAERHEG